jgi:hypothetical protein
VVSPGSSPIGAKIAVASADIVARATVRVGMPPVDPARTPASPSAPAWSSRQDGPLQSAEGRSGPVAKRAEDLVLGVAAPRHRIGYPAPRRARAKPRDRACEKRMADYDIPGVDELALHHFYRTMT